MKTCFKCGKEKPLIDFYKHKGMADGHLNKCKCCTKQDNINNRNENLEYYREYDRNRPQRIPEGYFENYRKLKPKVRIAQNTVNNAIRDGKLSKQPCEVCGSLEVHAHHCDYSKPLDVMWLCPIHHKAWHKENGAGLNKN